MFMSTTDDRNHIGNEWSHDEKLSEADVRSNNDTKHTKTFISRPFGNYLTCDRTPIYILLPTEHMSR